MNETWIDRARAQMRAGGISHQALADRLGCTRGAVGHYLSGRRRPSLKQLAEIARALQVAPAWLLHDNGSNAVQEQAADYGKRDHLVPVVGDSGPGRGSRQARLLRVPTPARNCYAMPITNDAYSPRMFAGETILIDPGEEPLAGDEVVIHRRSGPPSIHTYINKHQGRVIVENVSGNRSRKSIREREIKFMHKIIAVFRAGEELRRS
ncbi:MAG: helix-turn-helix domain-containing protein [Gammaproteobacteria bacterium]|nr:helix-turn-helix domain-containing protein [Gammaproteobacteria bacterium]